MNISANLIKTTIKNPSRNDSISFVYIITGLEGEGEITTVTVNSSKRKSLRSTIPMSVVKNMGLKVGDNISWKYEIRNGEIATIVRKVKKLNKR